MWSTPVYLVSQKVPKASRFLAMVLFIITSGWGQAQNRTDAASGLVDQPVVEVADEPITLLQTEGSIFLETYISKSATDLNSVLTYPTGAATAGGDQGNLLVNSEYDALMEFYNSTNGPSWTHRDNWGTGSTPCNWYGVSCVNGRVTLLYPRNNNLSGTLPSSLSALTNLQTLVLSNNNLSGPIPAGLSTLTNLQILNLSDNNLRGCMPASLSALCGRTVNLSNNPGLPGGGNFTAFCQSGQGSDAFQVTARATPNPACVGQSVSLSVTAGTSYRWSGPNGFSATAQTPSLSLSSVSQSGLYSVTVANGSGSCVATSSVSLAVNSWPVASLLSSGTLTCAQNSVTLTAGGGSTYVFRGPNGPLSSSGNTVVVSQPGLYSVTVTATSGCQSTTSLNVSQLSCSIRYVRQGGTGAGTSWADASGNLQAMIESQDVQQVWVAAGTYKPTTNTGPASRTLSFAMKNGVQILGGFPATGLPGLAERNPAGNPTLLSGEIGGAGNADNAYHVFKNPARLDDTAVLDGFIITGGNANGSSEEGAGGGMFTVNSTQTLINCTFQNNSSASLGGGLFNGNTAPTLTNCWFLNNSAVGGGGGLVIGNGGTLTNCHFQNNSSGTIGGGLYSAGSDTRLTNCSFLANSAREGGGIYCGTSATMTNCSFLNNSAAEGGAISGNGKRLRNCVLFGNGGENSIDGRADAAYCLFEVGETDYDRFEPNLTTSVSPFVSSTSTQLNACSPAINAGNYQVYAQVGGPQTDLAGQPRVFPAGGQIDMGAYEFQSTTTSITLTNPVVATATQGVTFSQSFTASGGSQPFSFSLASGNLPTGLSLATTGVLSGTPTQSGSFSVIVLATDASGCSGLSSAYRLMVVNATPTLSGLVASPNPVCVGTPLAFTATVGNLTTSYNYTLTTGSTSLTGTQASPAFSQSLTTSSVGEQSVTLTVEVNGQRTSAVSSLTVNPIPTAPSLQASAMSTINRPISVTASGCSGGSINWSLQGGTGTATGSLYTLSQPGNYTLLARCALGSCTSPATSLTLSIAASGPLQLLAPTYDCASGSITFNTQGGDGSLIEYFAIGITPWSLNPQHTVEAELREDPKKVELLARQSGQTVSYRFDLPAFCAGLPTPPQSSTNPEPVLAQGIGAQTAYQQQSYRFEVPAGTFVDPQGEALRYYVLGLPPGLSFNGSIIAGTPTQTGMNTITVIAVDPLGQTANTSFELRVEPPVPDLTPVIYLRPSLVYGNSSVSLLVDVVENNGVASSGSITVRIPKVAGLNLDFDAGVSQVGNRQVQNGAWTFSATSASYYELTTTQSITGGNQLSVYLSGTLIVGATSGKLSVSAVVLGGGEVRLTNNTDADKLEYFQQ